MSFALLLAAAKDPPLVDLDNTVFIQLGIFVITAIALSQLLFKPYLKLRADRAEGIEGARDKAKRMDEQARAQMADYETKFGRAKIKSAEERTKLRAEATARENEITSAARAAAQSAVDSSKETIQKDAQAARAQLQARSAEIAKTIAKKVLGREVA